VDQEKGRSFTYDDLRQAADRFAEICGPGGKRLALLFGPSTFETVAAYVGLLRAGHAVQLAPPDLDEVLCHRLIAAYRPDIVWPAACAPQDAYAAKDAGLFGQIAVARSAHDGPPPHEDLGVLLPTSGSLGSPKYVRLTYGNVQANAESIVEYLGIGPDERALMSLPFSYSYGLSLVNTHLLAGASIAITSRPIVMGGTWDFFRTQGCTSIAGVPPTYHALARTGFLNRDLPSLRTMTQAGGKLAASQVVRFHEYAAQRGVRFFVMYGQTEASARISYVPWDRLPEKAGSIGIAIPRGRLSVDGDAGGPDSRGELVYSGPNVMYGYATSRDCLAKGDELGGVLRTGDMGYVDEEGFFFVTGRLRRFMKVFGVRMNLDELERALEEECGTSVACVGRDNQLAIVVESGDRKVSEHVRTLALQRYHLQPSLFRIEALAALPQNSSGKKDYGALEEAYLTASANGD
jgi:acyl-CoA synthetase (AMP-forming)/AMP-acid ligase II